MLQGWGEVTGFYPLLFYSIQSRLPISIAEFEGALLGRNRNCFCHCLGMHRGKSLCVGGIIPRHRTALEVKLQTRRASHHSRASAWHISFAASMVHVRANFELDYRDIIVLRRIESWRLEP